MRLITADFAKGAGHIIRGDAVVLMTAAVLVLVLPKIVSIEDYGYWQYYLLLASYIHIVGLGWSEGISLRYSGRRFADIELDTLRDQLSTFAILLSIVAALMLLGASFFEDDSTRSVIQLLALSLPITNLRYFLLYTLQATQRMRESSYVVMIDRILFLLFAAVAVTLNNRTFVWLILASVAARTVSLLSAIYYTACTERSHLLARPFSKSAVKEMRESVAGGYKVLLAGLAGLSVIGIARFAVEDRWGIETFASFSFSLALINLFLVFVNSVGIASFPHLRRLHSHMLSTALSRGRSYLSLASAVFLTTFFPMAIVISAWLPTYSDAPSMLALVFPLIVFEARQSVLLTPLLKTLRLESLLLAINTSAFVLSLFATFMASYVIESLPATLLMVVVVSGARAFASDRVLARHLRTESGVRVWAEDVLIVVTFLVATGPYTHPILGVLGYTAVVAILLLSKRAEVVLVVRQLHAFWRRG